MTGKIKRWSRIPTTAEIAAFDGLHCSALYREAVFSGWRCPCCNRSAVELIRWTEIMGPTWRARYGDAWGMGFTIAFARHHCHGRGRFPQTVICGDCNAADGAAKRKLKLPAEWSFSPDEIRQFVKTTPHSGRTIIDYDVAAAIYASHFGGIFA